MGRKVKINAKVQFIIDLDEPVTINGGHKIAKLGELHLEYFGTELKRILIQKHKKHNIEITEFILENVDMD